MRRTLPWYIFTGHTAKRRIFRCNNQDIINCFFGRVATSNETCIEFGNGFYKKISGDVSQPDFFSRNYSSLNYEGGYRGVCYCVMNSNSLHYNINNSLISKSKVTSVKCIPGEIRIGTTEGTTYGQNGKFNNPNYIGKYIATHIYKKLPTGIIEYTNKYTFENGNISEAIYIIN